MALKFALLIVVVIAVLCVLRFLGIIARRDRGRPAAGAPRRARVEETQRCTACGTYVTAATPQGCERASCPYPRLR